MELGRLFQLLVLLVLLSYFTSRIINAKNKLEARKIATLIEKKRSPTVQDSTLVTYVVV